MSNEGILTTGLDASASKKRGFEHLETPQDTKGQKLTKVHPFFTKSKVEAYTGTFKWLDPLGPSKSCLHGINLKPAPSTKVAAFDLDGVLIKSEFPKTQASIDAPPWEWWRASVPKQLTEIAQAGYSIVVISNQGIKPAALKNWKLKIVSLAAAIPDIPFSIFAATAKDGYRKPMIGMWTELERIYRAEGVEIDKTQSFFVGDAAGRQYTGQKGDFASTDRKWALNVDIPFQTPEEYFLKLAPHTKYTLPGFNVSSLPTNLPTVTPTSSPILPAQPKQEVVIFVGYPCLGKTTFYRKYFQTAGYIHINQDILKTRDKCIKAAQEALDRGESCVIDNTNRDKATRMFYLDVARRSKVPVRCFLFTGSFELAWHNNLYRAFNLPPSVAASETKRALVPYLGFSGFRDKYDEPILNEGFTEIKKVNWVFDGTDEERRYWSMWLQLEGK